MSRRTAAADKAIRLAWEKERALVAEGKGTRDWTEEQQKDILDPNKGKAYDDDGKAFEGQHMKSVEKYPEYQGDPDNIQFLSKKEHLEAHLGNWQNPTNWYYDPVTKKIHDFGEGEYKPCEKIKLSNPIAITVNNTDSEVNDSRLNNSQRQENIHSKVLDKPQLSSSSKVKDANVVTPSSVEKRGTKEKAGSLKYIIGGIENALNKAKKISNDHPIITCIVASAIGTAVATVATEVSKNDIASGKSSNNNPQSDDNDLNFDYDENNTTDNDFDNEPVDDTLEKSKRSSPRENDVPESRQRYHTKNGVEWRDKAPYHRGGKKDEDDDQE